MQDESFKQAETSHEQHVNAIWHTLSDQQFNRKLNKMGCELRRSMFRQKSQICHIHTRASAWIVDVKSLLNWARGLVIFSEQYLQLEEGSKNVAAGR